MIKAKIPPSVLTPPDLQPGDLFQYPTMGHFILFLGMKKHWYQTNAVGRGIFYAFTTNKVVDMDLLTVFNTRYGEIPVRVARV